MDLSHCTRCLYPIRNFDYLLKQTFKRIKDDIEGQYALLWTCNGIIFIYRYRSRSWIMSLNFLRKDFRIYFSPNNRYHGYYVLEVFMQFAERYLPNVKVDLLHRCEYTDCMVRIPDTCNIEGLHKGLNLKKSRVKIIQERDGI